MRRAVAAGDANNEDIAASPDGHNVERYVRHARLKTAACNLFQAKNLWVHLRGERRQRYRDPIGRIDAENEIAARSVSEGRSIGQEFRVVGVGSTVRCALVLDRATFSRPGSDEGFETRFVDLIDRDVQKRHMFIPRADSCATA
jgi:hypothetical protein